MCRLLLESRRSEVLFGFFIYVCKFLIVDTANKSFFTLSLNFILLSISFGLSLHYLMSIMSNLCARRDRVFAYFFVSRIAERGCCGVTGRSSWYGKEPHCSPFKRIHGFLPTPSSSNLPAKRIGMESDGISSHPLLGRRSMPTT